MFQRKNQRRSSIITVAFIEIPVTICRKSVKHPCYFCAVSDFEGENFSLAIALQL